jgi:hypothetical protein
MGDLLTRNVVLLSVALHGVAMQAFSFGDELFGRKADPPVVLRL